MLLLLLLLLLLLRHLVTNEEEQIIFSLFSLHELFFFVLNRLKAYDCIMITVDLIK
jgi:hypothetical protein